MGSQKVAAVENGRYIEYVNLIQSKRFMSFKIISSWLLGEIGRNNKLAAKGIYTVHGYCNKFVIVNIIRKK